MSEYEMDQVVASISRNVIRRYVDGPCDFDEFLVTYCTVWSLLNPNDLIGSKVYSNAYDFACELTKMDIQDYMDPSYEITVTEQ